GRFARAARAWPGRGGLHVGLRQHVRDRGARRRAPRRPQLATESELWPLCRAALGLALYGAAGLEPALLALPHPPDRAPHRALRARRPRADAHRAEPRERNAHRAAALGPDA